MRLWKSLGLLALLSPVIGEQTYYTTSTTTLVDALSADPDYTKLLSLLQRARLIPTLNRLNGSTLFAPTNDAIERNKLWSSASTHDNIHEKLRQELFYHLLNYTLSEIPSKGAVEVHKTLHFPQTHVEPPTDEPAPAPPWLPVPGGSLGGQPQRVRLAGKEEGAWAGVDAFGEGGAQIIKEVVHVTNGALYGLSDVLTVPPDLAKVVAHEPSVSYFHKILTPKITHVLNSTSEVTLFLPVDAAWDALHPLERTYLESEFAADDLNRILDMHAVNTKKVTWSDSFPKNITLTTIDGTKIDIVATPGKTTVSSAKLVKPDIYASNGVLHLVSELLIPPGALQLTPEKYLLASNCTKFVSLIHSVNLTHLINSTDVKYTVLAPRDDVLNVLGEDELPEMGSAELKRMLLYHFIPGKWSDKKLKDGVLLETALQDVGLGGGRQVLDVEVSDKEGKNIRFGGAGTIGEHVEANNTLIYYMSRPLVPPSDPLQTILPSLELSSFLAAIFSTSLADILRVAPRTTLLVPHNSAFERLGLLVSAHLLAATSKDDLSAVIQHHAIDGVEYAAALRNGSGLTFPTREGSDIKLERFKTGDDKKLLLSPSGGWAGMRSELMPKNMLTQTGVVHELSDLMIPRSVELTLGKLMKAAKGTTMVSMVTKAGMGWLLNGTAPPDGSPWADAGLTGTGWTLLCPTDDAFKSYNLTSLLADVDALQSIVSQHLIPVSSPVDADSTLPQLLDALNNNRPLSLDDSATYSTLLSPSSAYGDIIVRWENGSYVLGINGARGTNGNADWARVLAWGRSTTGGGIGGVIQIDRLIMPYYPTNWREYGVPVVVGILGVALICAFFLGVRAVWRKDATEATYEPVGGFGRDDIDDP
ncbi:hypothetical protein HWV62_6521 [Athelia sp. TMB]|nr:hypothetical protein HWV62_6521 [Athelia sp. TMB]